jgi:hypothetical protein
MSKLIRASLFALAAATLMSGCVPYPVYKKLQPAAKATVRGAANEPLEQAEVTLISSAHPYGFEQHRQMKKTLADGTATFDARREMRVEVMVIHGWQEFFWNWCVRKEGYTTYLTRHNGAADFQENLFVQLQPGVTTPCPLPNTLGTRNAPVPATPQ